MQSKHSANKIGYPLVFKPHRTVLIRVYMLCRPIRYPAEQGWWEDAKNKVLVVKKEMHIRYVPQFFLENIFIIVFPWIAFSTRVCLVCVCINVHDIIEFFRFKVWAYWTRFFRKWIHWTHTSIISFSAFPKVSAAFSHRIPQPFILFLKEIKVNIFSWIKYFLYKR